MPPHSRPNILRLRLRFSQLRHDALRLAKASAALCGIAGVVSVDASPITGGMLLHYDRRMASPRFWDEIERTLCEFGLHSNAPHAHGSPRHPAYGRVSHGADGDALAQVGRTLALSVLATLAERFVRRSALVFATALL